MLTFTSSRGGKLLSGRATVRSLLVLIMSLWESKQATGSLLDQTIGKWYEYKTNCTNMLASRSPHRTGVFCNGTFDQFACWPDSPPGNVSVPCPFYLPWIAEGRAGKLYRYCAENGTWLTVGGTKEIWRDHSECSEQYHHFQQQEKQHVLLTTLRYISTIGYSLSLLSLSLAVFILMFVSKLHCTRNQIHVHLFASFMLRAMVVLVKDLLLHITYSQRPTEETGWRYYFNSEITTACRATHVFMHYSVGANMFWLLVEGLYLHTLLFSSVLSETRLMRKYMLIGWGSPVLFVVPWITAKALLENDGCWGTNIDMRIWWIIRGPMMLPFAVNFIIFIKILRLLLSKLKAHQTPFNDYKYRLARATLVLIPLLGTQEFVFMFVTDEQVSGRLHIRLFVQLPISSFQGFIVSLLYCFASWEVQAELKKRWRLFLFTHQNEQASCFLEKPFKYLGKYSTGRRTNHYFNQNECYGDVKRPSNVQLLQVTTNPTIDLCPPGLTEGQCFTRGGSLSSSEWDGTLGETVEEILEESGM
ncbi:glucagon-like peptide 2 receptor [Erpetoichthys calabaricus]|uniref:glucagon-like peptide 2 receptor n=1 Tax=Erpetoichthys calabaricus TaxID=27687 RepID=UPI002233FD02|nr:glucagon-like peptide 2 receptor [Erpetoichthys calabaricus]